MIKRVEEIHLWRSAISQCGRNKDHNIEEYSVGSNLSKIFVHTVPPDWIKQQYLPEGIFNAYCIGCVKTSYINDNSENIPCIIWNTEDSKNWYKFKQNMDPVLYIMQNYTDHIDKGFNIVILQSADNPFHIGVILSTVPDVVIVPLEWSREDEETIYGLSSMEFEL